MAKKRVAILFGGVSNEHEISLISAAAIAENIPKSQYEVLKIGITKKGRWLLFPGPVEMMRNGSWDKFADNVPAFISPDRTNHGIIANHDGRFDLIKLAAAFPVLHGRNGEDGTIQGLLELAGIPYVGCNVLASALCMDKAAANRMFDAAHFPQAPWLCADRRELDDFDQLAYRIGKKLDFPIFVKPAVGGSSVGITKVHDIDELRDAMKLAGAHDTRIVFEQAIEGAEVECAVLGNRDLFASLPGEIESCHEIYDYDAKYKSDGKSKLFLPARLPEEKQREVRDMALAAYKALGCAGLARIDFFVEKDSGRVLINEINTMPGFTPISMYPKLMEMSGVPYPELMDKLLQLAFERADA